MEETKKRVSPLGDFGCQSFPLIKDRVYDITEEELKGLANHTLKWCLTPSSDVELVEIENEDGTITKEYKDIFVYQCSLVPNDPSQENRIKEINKRISQLKQLLKETDYYALKYAEGCYTDEEYAERKATRQSYRDEINELEEELMNYEE